MTAIDATVDVTGMSISEQVSTFLKSWDAALQESGGKNNNAIYTPAGINGASAQEAIVAEFRGRGWQEVETDKWAKANDAIALTDGTRTVRVSQPVTNVLEKLLEALVPATDITGVPLKGTTDADIQEALSHLPERHCITVTTGALPLLDVITAFERNGWHQHGDANTEVVPTGVVLVNEDGRHIHVTPSMDTIMQEVEALASPSIRDRAH